MMDLRRLALLSAFLFVVPLFAGCGYLWGVKYNNDGYARFLNDRKWEAIDYYDIALSKFTKSARTFNNRGITHYHIGHYSQALHDYNRSLYYDEDYTKTYNSRGNLFLEIGVDERAMRDLNAASYLDEDYAQPNFNRARAYLGRENLELARLNANRAIEFWEERYDEEWAEGYYLRAMIHERAGRHEQAAADFELATQFMEEQYGDEALLMQPVKPAIPRYEAAVAEYHDAESPPGYLSAR